MSASLRQYPDYQPMDAPWCPRIPAHWQSKRLGSLLRERGEVNHDYEEQNVLSVLRDIGVIPYADKGNVGNKKSEDIARYKIVRPNDIVLNSMNVIIGSVGRSRYQGCLSPVYYVLTPRNSELTAEFAESIFQVKPFQQSLIRIGYGILAHRMRIPMELLKSEALPLPPTDEQAQIVRFIRHLDQRVNRLIKTKRRLIELLNEQKQAIIHRAVTRGLDPTVPLKPSGIEWLGEVPSNWNLKRFKFVTQIVSGQVDPRISPFREMVLVAPNHIEKATGSLIGRETADEQGADSGKYLVKRGQVIYSKIRPNLQKATIAQEDCLCSADMYPIQPRPSELSPDYLLMLMLSKPFTQYVVDCSMRVAMPKVNRDALGNGWLWYPDLDSQTQILEFITSEGAPFDEAIARSRSEIDFIREYRTRLVADVVTGQLDVRHLDLPEVEESLIEAIDAGSEDDTGEDDVEEEVIA